MAGEEDQSTWLPKPPPPRPARRDAAIDAALRKFDGEKEAPEPVRERRERRSWTRRPQFAVAVSAMLLLIIGIPAALVGIRNAPHSVERSSPPAVQYAPAAPPAAARLPAPVATTDVAQTPASPPVAPAKPASPSSNSAEAKVSAPTETLAAEPPMVAAPPAPAPVVAAAPPPPPPPPPPPSPPAAVASEQGMADNVVVTGSRMRKPALEAPSAARSMSSGQKYANFLSRLQSAVRTGNHSEVIALIDFPLRVNAPGGARIYRDPASVERDFDQIFTARVKRAIVRQRADRLFVRDQGAMIGDGEVWFDQTCPNAACSPPGPVFIRAVNP
jgi:hypothetical protein